MLMLLLMLILSDAVNPDKLVENAIGGGQQEYIMITINFGNAFRGISLVIMMLVQGTAVVVLLILQQSAYRSTRVG